MSRVLLNLLCMATVFCLRLFRWRGITSSPYLVGLDVIAPDGPVTDLLATADAASGRAAALPFAPTIGRFGFRTMSPPPGP